MFKGDDGNSNSFTTDSITGTILSSGANTCTSESIHHSGRWALDKTDAASSLNWTYYLSAYTDDYMACPVTTLAYRFATTDAFTVVPTTTNMTVDTTVPGEYKMYVKMSAVG